jgi:glycine betaine catabolism B
MMNNNDNKKSAGLWTQRLFRQSSVIKDAPQGKTYFPHRYHDGYTVPAQSSFSTLFSDVDNHQPKFEADTASCHPLPDGEFSQSIDSIRFKIQSSALQPAKNETLSAQCTVLNCYDETSDTKTFRLGRLDGEKVDYLPGQYITLSVVIGGQEYKRSYSLASSPSHQGIFEITVKRDPNGGVVSNWLNKQLDIGDTLTVKGPFGKFTCANNTPKKILFLAAGSGIVPIMSMLRWLADTEAGVDVTLLLSFQTLYDIIYGEELRLIAARHKNIKLFITLTKEPLALNQWTGLMGRVNEKMLNALVPDLQGRAVYLCGPDAFMAECKKHLLNLAVPAEQVFCESFTVNSPQLVAQTKAQTSIIGRPPKQISGNYRIRFAKSGKTIVANGGVSLLELAEQSGISISHECRAGSCGECMVKCLKGRVEMTEQAEIADFDRKKGWVYACCAYPASNAVLDI